MCAVGSATNISWTDATHNPWIGCVQVSPGCKNCYAAVSTPTRVHREKGLELWGPPATTARLRTSEANRKLPLRWDRAAAKAGIRMRVFCSSLADVFEDHPSLPAWRADLFALIESTPNLDWQLLTKRPQNITRMVPPAWLESPRPNVWFGTTVENQGQADLRIIELRKVPAVIRFLSMEPLLEGVDLDPLVCDECGEAVACVRLNERGPWCVECHGPALSSKWLGLKRHQINWIIVGGESGPSARPFNLAWARSVVDQCKDAGVPVFVKQLGLRAQGTWVRGGGAGTYRMLDARDPDLAKHRFMLDHPHGADPTEWPEDLRVQQMPMTESAR